MSCVQCGANFNPDDHPQVAAGMIQPSAILKCPDCLAQGNLSETEAVAAAMRIGLEAQAADEEEVSRYLKQFGATVAVFGLLGFGLSFVYTLYTRGRAEAGGILGYGVSLIATVAGVALFQWARSRKVRQR